MFIYISYLQCKIKNTLHFCLCRDIFPWICPRDCRNHTLLSKDVRLEWLLGSPASLWEVSGLKFCSYSCKIFTTSVWLNCMASSRGMFPHLVKRRNRNNFKYQLVFVPMPTIHEAHKNESFCISSLFIFQFNYERFFIFGLCTGLSRTGWLGRPVSKITPLLPDLKEIRRRRHFIAQNLLNIYKYVSLQFTLPSAEATWRGVRAS